MSNPTVKVGYDGSKLTFDPDQLSVSGKNVTVMWQPAPGSDVESVTGVEIAGWTGNQPTKVGDNVHWVDPNSKAETLKYTCTAQVKNVGPVTTDPEIINTGG